MYQVESTVQDLTLLYELSLATGRSLELKENCAQFLKLLMGRKNLKYVSVWLRENLLDESSGADLSLVYSSPRLWRREIVLPAEHDSFKLLEAMQDFCIVSSADEPQKFADCISEKKIQQGTFSIFRLQDIGYLKLYVSADHDGVSSIEMSKLLNVIDAFATSLKACLAHQKSITENARRQQTEQALLASQQMLSEKLEEVREQHTALETSRALLDRKHQRLKKALTQLKKTQAQLVQTEKMSGLGQMVAGIAHEINNPISFIYGNLKYVDEYSEQLVNLLNAYQAACPDIPQDLQEELEDADFDFIAQDFPKVVDSMRMGSQRVREIVLALRNFSRLDESDKKIVDVHEGIDNTLLILKHRLTHSHVDVQIEVVKQYGDLPLIECYCGQLNQVFMNLLSNAIEAVDARELHSNDDSQTLAAGQITIRTECLVADRIRITIADNGLGIPADIQPKIFEPFYTTKDVGKGTGLGLSISHQVITELHQGTIRCESSPGQGAKFILELPIKLTPTVLA